jgi:signal peptidase I
VRFLRRRSLVRELLETAVLTIGIFLVVRVALQNFKVEGLSMIPSLHDGEYILVNKIDYLIHSPNRGDIVVFHAVSAGQPDKDFIKRVIGLPGDRVQVMHQTVYINGHALKEPYEYEAPTYNWGPEVVPKDDYFVLGDNRNNSADSHQWPLSPWLTRSDIVGKAWIAYWPLSDLHIFSVTLPNLGL